jgi:hypothetical protein
MTNEEIFTYNDENPTLYSPNQLFELPFAQTRETLQDTEVYKRFLENAIQRCRRSATYSHYKAFLINLGLDRCQFHGNIINSEEHEMATIEMHHNVLTIFDIAFIICEHILKTKGKITSFDLVQLLKEEHKNHRVQLVMLSLTPHQLYHDSDDFFIGSNMCFGDWISFLYKYNMGISQDIAYKILYYIDKNIKLEGNSDDAGLLQLRKDILDWSRFNDTRII